MASCGTHIMNGDPQVQRLVLTLKDAFSISTVVETGSFVGHTTKWFGETFQRVVCHEKDPNYIKQTQANCAALKNIVFVPGDSGATIQKTVDELTSGPEFGTVLFYLDAHWETDWPLLQEIEAIGRGFGKAPSKQFVVIIDDFKTPDRPYGFDMYGEQPNDINFVKSTIETVAPGAVWFYLDHSEHPNTGTGRLFVLSHGLARELETFADFDKEAQAWRSKKCTNQL